MMMIKTSCGSEVQLDTRTGIRKRLMLSSPLGFLSLEVINNVSSLLSSEARKCQAE